MKKSTLLFLGSFSALIIILLSISINSSNSRIEEEIAGRGERNLLREIIDSTNNEHAIINESLIGKTVVINVWATWCQPCIMEMPELNSLVKDFASDDIVFVAFDDRDSTEEMEVMKEKDLQFDYQLYFAQEELIDLLYTYKLSHEQRALPLNLVLNTEGKVVTYYMGNQPEKLGEIRTYLESL